MPFSAKLRSVLSISNLAGLRLGTFIFFIRSKEAHRSLQCVAALVEKQKEARFSSRLSLAWAYLPAPLLSAISNKKRARMTRALSHQSSNRSYAFIASLLLPFSSNCSLRYTNELMS